MLKNFNMILIFQAACILDNVAIFSLGVYKHSNDNLIGKTLQNFLFWNPGTFIKPKFKNDEQNKAFQTR